MGRVILRELLLLSAAFALAATGAEAYLRAFRPQNLMTPAYTERYGITALLPNARIREHTPYFDASYTTNDLGLRGPTVPQEKPAGVTRVLSLGGSFTFGTGVGDEETYSRLLEKSLNAAFPGRAFQVLNFGWGGTAMNFQELLYRKLGRLYAPDVLLVHMHFIRVDNLAAGDVLRLEDAPPSGPKSRARRLLRALPGYAFLCEHSHLWALKRKSLSAGAGAAGPALSAPAAPGPSQEELQRRYAETFEGLIDEACAAKTKVLVMKDKNALASFPLIDADLRRKAAQTRCLEVVDLEISPRHIFGPGEKHWNREGHAYAAEKVFSALKNAL